MELSPEARYKAGLAVTAVVAVGTVLVAAYRDERPRLDPDVLMGTIEDPNEPCFPMEGWRD